MVLSMILVFMYSVAVSLICCRVLLPGLFKAPRRIILLFLSSFFVTPRFVKSQGGKTYSCANKTKTWETSCFFLNHRLDFHVDSCPCLSTTYCFQKMRFCYRGMCFQTLCFQSFMLIIYF